MTEERKTTKLQPQGLPEIARRYAQEETPRKPLSKKHKRLEREAKRREDAKRKGGK